MLSTTRKLEWHGMMRSDGRWGKRRGLPLGLVSHHQVPTASCDTPQQISDDIPCFVSSVVQLVPLALPLLIAHLLPSRLVFPYVPLAPKNQKPKRALLARHPTSLSALLPVLPSPFPSFWLSLGFMSLPSLQLPHSRRETANNNNSVPG